MSKPNQKKKTVSVETDPVVVESPGKGQTGELVPLNLPLLAKGYLQEYQPPETDDLDVSELPDLIKNWREIPAEFPPTLFLQQEGDYVIGTYLGIEADKGPHKSNIYRLEVGQGKQMIRCGMWGNTALDGRMTRVKTGQRIAIIRGRSYPSTKGNDWVNYFVKIAG